MYRHDMMTKMVYLNFGIRMVGASSINVLVQFGIQGFLNKYTIVFVLIS